jgi:hypothetical protein
LKPVVITRSTPDVKQLRHCHVWDLTILLADVAYQRNCKGYLILLEPPLKEKTGCSAGGNNAPSPKAPRYCRGCAGVLVPKGTLGPVIEDRGRGRSSNRGLHKIIKNQVTNDLKMLGTPQLSLVIGGSGASERTDFSGNARGRLKNVGGPPHNEGKRQILLHNY